KRLGDNMRQKILALLCLAALAAPAQAAAVSAKAPPALAVTIAPPADVTADDTPNDAGMSISLSWKPSPDEARGIAGYEILRSDKSDGPYEKIGYVPVGIHSYDDQSVPADGKDYYYQVRAVGPGVQAESPAAGPARSRQQWYNSAKTNALIGTVLFTLIVIYFIIGAKRGRHLFIRKIAGLAAVEEAVGRATEMGKPILFCPGMDGVTSISTLAALNILGQVAKKAAEYDTPLLVPNRDPIVYTVAEEIVKEAYAKIGRPDAYNHDSVFYLTDNQMGYTSGVNGIMTRERPATNFFMGYFYAESLVLAETGATTGAIQIAGTDSITQLPFFITACDYTLLGEELYAASAYLGRQPMLIGTLKAQDWSKALLGLLLIIGTILALSGIGLRQLVLSLLSID
ncbi:MAG: fibronectin type III domain-containing protein, partial [Candidatus Edwardsbacteria bacterium]|nr:fibronectin type III domain-containing protein [Candidatus Edwardsbacteria bacterium]